MNLKKFLFAIILFSFSSCGFHYGIVSNSNNNVTRVDLNRKNFKVVDMVSGKSSSTYIFGIGGLSNKALIERAKSKMLLLTNLYDAPRAVINMTFETHVSIIYPIFYQKTVTVSAHVVEFTE